MWDVDCFNDKTNESDVEAKFITPFLVASEGLAYPSSAIKTKQYITEHRIGKRKSARNYVPDYLVYAEGLPWLVIEAKPPSDDVAEALREASEYALELNRHFPADANPIRYVAASNGIMWLWSTWDSASVAQEIAVTELVPGSHALESLRQALSFQLAQESSRELRQILTPPEWWNPIRLAGGAPIQGLTRRMNRFAAELYPILSRFLAKDVARDTPEIVERGYVETDERTEYERSIESLLKDNISRKLRPEAVEIQTRAKSLQSNILSAAAQQASTTTLLIGGVGSGKSLFLDRFRQIYMDEGLRTQVIWIVIDFNAAPKDPHEYPKWILERLVQGVQLELEQRGEELYDFNTLRRVFGREIAKKKRVLHGGSGGMTDEEFNRHMRTLLAQWMDDRDAMAQGIFDHYHGERGLNIAVIFDNADKRTSEEQVAVFQHSLALSARFPCSTFISMRDETYDIYASQPPLDAVSKHRVFRVQPPRLVDVVKKRLDLMIEHVETEMPQKLQYALQGGAVVEYDKSELRTYLRKVYDDLFSTHRRTRILIEAVAGKNIRRALEMFVGILVSPYLSERHLGLEGQFDNRTIPEYVVIRALMRGRYAYYADSRDESYIHNVFQIDETSASTDNFLVVELLAIMVRNRRRTGELGIEGYRRIRDLLAEPELMGYSRDDVMWAIAYCHEKGLVTAEAVGQRTISEDSFIKVSLSGYYHLQIATREEYMANVAMSTWMRDDTAAGRIVNAMRIGSEGDADRLGNVNRRFEVLSEYLREEADLHQKVASADADRLGGMNGILDGIRDTCERAEARRRGNRHGLFG